MTRNLWSYENRQISLIYYIRQNFLVFKPGLLPSTYTYSSNYIVQHVFGDTANFFVFTERTPFGLNVPSRCLQRWYDILERCIIIIIFFFLFAIVGVSITGRQILAGIQKVFNPPLKNESGDKTVTTSLVIYGGTVKVARASVYLICASPSFPPTTPQTTTWAVVEVSLLSMCTLLSHIYDPKVPHPR